MQVVQSMRRWPVDSSTVSSIGYEPRSMTLELEYRNGNVYRYFEVPAAIYHELLAASSIGAFVNTRIEPSFEFARV
jgi:hypothetical protein